MTSDTSQAACRTGNCSCSKPSVLSCLSSRCEVILAALFLWAAFNKLRPPNGPVLFSDSIHAFKLGLPDVLIKLSVGVVPWVEVLAATLLFLGIWKRGAAIVLSALLVVFLILIIQALARGLAVECGCFGKLSPFCPPIVGPCNIIQNTILLAMGLVIIAAPNRPCRCQTS